MNKIITQFDVKKKEDGGVTFIASKEIVDRDGDKVSIKGMDLSHFKNNPIMLWSHKHDLPAIGKWTNIKKTKIDGVPALTMEPKFAEGYDLAETVKSLVDQEIIKSVSVGFMPDYESIEFVPGKGKQKGYNYIKKCEIFETSLCNVPANQAALAKAVQDEIITKDQYRELTESTINIELETLRKMMEELKLTVDKLEAKEATDDASSAEQHGESGEAKEEPDGLLTDEDRQEIFDMFQEVFND